MASKMTTADLKGDTARGAAAISRAQSKMAQSKPKPVPAAKLPESSLVPGWDAYPVLVASQFGEMVDKRDNLKREIEFRQAKIKDLDVEIQALMMVAGTEKVIWEDRPVTIVHSRSGSKIVAEKLLMAGVPAQTIADATEEGKPYEYVLIGKPGK